MQKISIVISGGSSKGAYQIGFFKALAKSGLSPFVQSVSATSIGAINAYAFLENRLDLETQLWLGLDLNGIWKFRSKIKDFLATSFSRLINATDYIPCDFYITLSEMSTMTAEYFNMKGKMSPSKKGLLEATISIPLLTTSPLQHNGKLYFDGGVTDNIPIAPIVDKKQDILFIVHFTPDYQIKQETLRKEAEIVYIDMSKSEEFMKGNFNFKHKQVKRMIEEGERYSLQIINEYFSQKKDEQINNAKKNAYYYFSGARLLAILNGILQIEKNKRVLYITKAKLFYIKLSSHIKKK